MTTPAPVPSYAEIDKALTAPGSPFETVEMDMYGQRQLVWKNQVPTFGHLLAETLVKHPDRVCVSSPVGDPERAIAGDRERSTYAQVGEQAYALAGWMLEQGVRAGDPIALGGINTTKLVVAFIATQLLGAVPLLLNATLIGEAQVHCCTITRCKLILVDVKTADTLGPLRSELDKRGAGPTYCWEKLSLVAPAARGGVRELVVRASPASIADVKSGRTRKDVVPESDACILLTSGTTSMPKGVLLTHRIALHANTVSGYSVARHAMRLGAPMDLAVAAATTPPAEQGAILIPVPLFHLSGLAGMFRALGQGNKIVLMRRWDAELAITLMAREGVTSSIGVPSVFQAILQAKGERAGVKLAALSVGGSLPPARLASDVTSQWPDILLLTAYGMTETTGAHVTLTGPDLLRKPYAAGITYPTGQLRIVDPDTKRDVPPGTPGVIWMRGSNILKEYVNNPKATAAALVDGWMDSGDVGYVDDEGYLVVCDRQKDMIIRGGENIASAEIEHAVYADDRIAEVAAVAVPHELWGELVGIAVSLAPGATATPESIMAMAKTRLRMPAHPAIVVISDEPLPRNANGKLLKTDIKGFVLARWDAQGRDQKPTAKL